MTTYYVDPAGSDSASGAIGAPWRTVLHGLLTVRPGDNLLLHTGTYTERIMSPAITPALENARIQVAAVPGETPIIKGLFWLTDADYWTIGTLAAGIEFQWDDATGGASEHMVKMLGGTGWRFARNNVHGAKSFAGVLVGPSPATGDPRNCTVTYNAVYDTIATNGAGLDHLILCTAASGVVIGRNILYGAANGAAVHLGATVDDEGPGDVEVRYNTAYNCRRLYTVAFGAHDIEFHHNIGKKPDNTIATGSVDFGVFDAIAHTGANVVAHDNLGSEANRFIHNDGASSTGIADGGGNVYPLDPAFDGLTLAGFHALNPDTQIWGRYAVAAVPGTAAQYVRMTTLGSALRLKTWPATETEPLAWSQQVFSDDGIPDPGLIGIETELGASAAAGITPSYDDLVATFGALPVTHAQLGIFAKWRTDDAAVITALGGTPALNTDPDYLRKNAITRLELQIGRPFEVDRSYMAFTDTFLPAYDKWSMAQGRTVLLSFKARTLPVGGTVIPYGAVAAGTYDATIDAAADAIIAADPQGKLWLCYDHEPDTFQGYVATSTAARNAGATSVPVGATPIAIPDGFSLKFKGGGAVATATVNGDHAVGATTINLRAPGLSAAVPSGTDGALQTPAQAGADFVAAWKRIHDRMLARTGFDATGVKWVPIYINGPTVWNDGTIDLFYPGNAYCDIIGWDGAYITAANWRDFADIFVGNGGLDWFRAKGMPFLIGETGVNEDPADPLRAGTWIDNWLAFMKTLPDLKAACYFTGAALGLFLDTPPQGSAYKLSRYRALAEDPFFGGGGITEEATGVLSLVVAPAAVAGGDTAAGTIMLDGIAGIGGMDVALWSDQGAADVPSMVHVVEGSTGVEFSIATTAVDIGVTATITATGGLTSRTAELEVGAGIPGPAETGPQTWEYVYNGLTFGGSVLPIFLTEVDGLGGFVAREEDDEKGAKHGSFTFVKYLTERRITFSGRVFAPTPSARASLLSDVRRAFTPNNVDKLLVMHLTDGLIKVLRAKPTRSEIPMTPETIGRDGSPFTVELVAGDPLIYESTTRFLQMGPANVKPSGLLFPAVAPFEFLLGAQTFAKVRNVGNMATPPVITFYGPATDPQIVNLDTGERLKVGIVLVAGDVLTVDFGAHTVILNDTASRYASLDAASADFFDLDPGVTRLEFLADATTPATNAVVEWAGAWSSAL